MAKGVTALATEVDHKTPLSMGGLDVDDNTRNLCQRHHRDATAIQFGQRVRVAIGPDGWAVT
jgi:5-methylcytosine-specific restriction protein A